MLPALALMIATGTTVDLSLPDAVLDERIQFLEQSLERPEQHAEIWWWGWLSFYSLGAVVQGGRLGLVDPDDEHARGARADYIVSIVKSAAGIASLLLLPLHATEGAVPMDVRGDRVARMLAGEAALAENARQADRRSHWLRHAIMVAMNLAGGAIVWFGFDDPRRAAISTAIGIGVGEIVLWSAPWDPSSSWAEYQARYVQ